MSNIKKTFESFLNEELNKDTYLSAADKLKKLGHKGRADELETYAKSNDVVSYITINSTKYEMNESNIQIDDRFKSLNITLFNVEDKADERFISINYKADDVKVSGNDGIKDRMEANKLFKFVKKMIEKYVDEHPHLENLLTKLKVNHLYKD